MVNIIKVVLLSCVVMCMSAQCFASSKKGEGLSFKDIHAFSAQGGRYGDSRYIPIENIYEYFNYDEDLSGSYVDNLGFILIDKSQVISILIEDVLFKPDDFLAYRVSVSVNKGASVELISFFKDRIGNKIAIMISDKVVAVCTVYNEINSDFSFWVVGRSKEQIKNELSMFSNVQIK